MLAARVEQKNGTYVHNIQTGIQLRRTPPASPCSVSFRIAVHTDDQGVAAGTGGARETGIELDRSVLSNAVLQVRGVAVGRLEAIAADPADRFNRDDRELVDAGAVHGARVARQFTAY